MDAQQTAHLRGRSVSLHSPPKHSPVMHGLHAGRPGPRLSIQGSRVAMQPQSIQPMQPMQPVQPVQYAQPPSFGQWPSQPIPGLFHLVPADGSHPGYQHAYPQQYQQQHQQHQQQQPHQTQYQPYLQQQQPQHQYNQHQHQHQHQHQNQLQQFQQPFYTTPSMAMSSASPTPSFVSPMSPLRRQLSLGMVGSPGGMNGMSTMGGYYQPQPQSHQPEQAQAQHISPQQNTGVSAPGPAYMGHYAVSPHVNSHTSSMPVPNMLFSTPPSERHMSVGMGGAAQEPSIPQPLAPAPATVPRAAPTAAESSLDRRMKRQHRPKPLLLSPSAFGRASRESRWVSQDSRHSRSDVTYRPVPSVTPVGSDREYDAGGSSCSSSPIGSETHHTSNGGSYHNYIFGMRSETSEAGTDGPVGAGRGVGHHWSSTAPRTMPRMPKFAGSRLASDEKDDPLSPTPRARSLRASLGKDRLRLLQPGLSYCDEDGAVGDFEVEREQSVRGVEYSSSDEWYTTSDTNPIRRRHRHRVATDTDGGSYAYDNRNKCDDDSGDYYDYYDNDGGGVDGNALPRYGKTGFCNCGMRQCFDCGLFISRPESHECMVKSGRCVLG